MKWVWGSVSISIIAVLLFVYTTVQHVEDQNRVRRLAESTNAALCTFKNDLEHRYIQGLEFLTRHPDGIPGIGPVDIQRSLDNQKSTLDALAALECPQDSTN